MSRTFTAGVALAAIATILAACGSGSTSQAEQDRRAEEYARSFGIDASVRTGADGSRSVTVNQNLGGLTAQTGTNVALPEGFPDDVPVYPQANIVTASQLAGQGFMVQGRSADAIDAIGAFYSSGMTGRGWTQDSAQRTPAMHIAQYSKAGRTASVSLVPDKDGTTIQLTVMGSR